MGRTRGVKANTSDISKLDFLFQLLVLGTPELKSGVIASQGGFPELLVGCNGASFQGPLALGSTASLDLRGEG